MKIDYHTEIKLLNHCYKRHTWDLYNRLKRKCSSSHHSREGYKLLVSPQMILRYGYRKCVTSDYLTQITLFNLSLKIHY